MTKEKKKRMDTGKKSPHLKSTMNPYASKIMPMIGHPTRTKKKPEPNENVPCPIIKEYHVSEGGEKIITHTQRRESIRKLNLVVLAFHEELCGGL